MELGSEIGIRINIKKEQTFLEKFHFTVSHNRLDTATFRLNIYNLKNGLPNQNILKDNILIRLGKETGTFTIDLTLYNIFVSEDIFISIEWIDGTGELHGGIFFSAAFFNSGTYIRKTSQAKWKKYRGMGVGFNLDVNY